MKNTLYHTQRLKARSISSNRPFRYVLVLTNLCNLRCSFCFQEKKYLQGSLDTNDWTKFIKSLPSGSHLTLTGGEPILFKGFEEIISNIPRDISFNLITNGLLLSEDISNLLLNSPSFRVLSISIDDVGNKSRDFNELQWENLLSNIANFKKLREITMLRSIT